MSDVAIFSCFGRGNWLAAELRDSGYAVTLVDVSSQLGRWTPEDWEGPFGFFQSEELLASQLARLTEEDYGDDVESGFCIWLKDGPLDLKGYHSSYLLKKHNVHQATEEYIRSYHLQSKDQQYKAKIAVNQLNYEDSWLALFSQQISATKFHDNVESLTEGSPLPLFSGYSVRRVSRRGAERSLQLLQESGVKVFAEAGLKDVQVHNKQAVGVEIESDWTGVLHAKSFVWMLTGEETAKCSERVAKILFPNGISKPEWVWVKYRFRFAENPALDSLPNKFVMLDDVNLPWTHNNVCFVQKSVVPSDVDVWMRVPEAQRFHRQYLSDLSERVIEMFKERIPKAELNLQEMPQDYLYDYNEIGPARFPVYSSVEKLKQPLTKVTNLSFSSPEQWDRLDWTGQLRHQGELFSKVEVELVSKSNVSKELGAEH